MSCTLFFSALFPPSLWAAICRPPFSDTNSFWRWFSGRSQKLCSSEFALFLEIYHLLHCRRCSWEGRAIALDCGGGGGDPDVSESISAAHDHSNLQRTRANSSESSGNFVCGDISQTESAEGLRFKFDNVLERQRSSTHLPALLRSFWKVAAPYWNSDVKNEARLRLSGVIVLTLATTGISVGFNLLGRDFYNALTSKDQDRFVKQLLYYLAALVVGIPIFVVRDYNKETLALHWRAWMTKFCMQKYFKNCTFYYIQSQSLVDNPDQRIVDDINAFTSTSIKFSMDLFNCAIDLISFSGILFSIYPPLFGVLIVYSLGGTFISVALGKGLIDLNFMQEKREADFRYGLVRIRENAESIAFYSGEGSEVQLLLERFKQSFLNYGRLLVNRRNLDFFTSGYRYLIQLLPAAVIAPLYFSGKIEFGVINQSFSAFNHVLSDFSIIVYQFQSLSAFSAVIERLDEFNDVLEQQILPFKPSSGKISISDGNGLMPHPQPHICIVNLKHSTDGCVLKVGEKVPLMEIENLTLQTPQYTNTLVKNLSLAVNIGDHLLIVGPSGAGKTSLLRAIAGLWRAGTGTIRFHLRCENEDDTANLDNFQGGTETNGGIMLVSADERTNAREVVNHNREFIDAKFSKSAPDMAQMLFFLPQKPYLILGSLRQQVLYPTWNEETVSSALPQELLLSLESASSDSHSHRRLQPSDKDILDVLERVQLGHLVTDSNALDSRVEWVNVLSLGEQQRLAFARLLLSRPKLALMDESTSSLDEDNEALLYRELMEAGVTYISIGHRSSLQQFHSHLLTLRSSDEDGKSENWTFTTIKKQERN